MVNLRAFNIVHKLNELADSIEFNPPDIIENDSTVEQIINNGFEITFQTERNIKEMEEFLLKADLVNNIELHIINGYPEKPITSKHMPHVQISLKDSDEQLAQMTTHKSTNNGSKSPGSKPNMSVLT
jgi:two-component system chemotaxis sensor kinase CheA